MKNKIIAVLLAIFSCIIFNNVYAINIETYEKSDKYFEAVLSNSYDRKTRNQIQDYAEKGDYKAAINILLNIVNNPTFYTNREIAFLDLIYLVSMDKNYDISNKLITDFKNRFSNIDSDLQEWINYMEIYNLSQIVSEEYDLTTIINNFLNNYPESVWTEHILFLKANHALKQNNFNMAVKTYELIYAINNKTIYFEEMFDLLILYYSNTEQYELAKELTYSYLNQVGKKVNVENEYYWLAQYYDAMNETKKAKGYFEKLAKNEDSALYPEALYWLGNYYRNSNTKKSAEFLRKLSNFEGYGNISLN